MKVESLLQGKIAAVIDPSASLEDLVAELKLRNVGALVVTIDGRNIVGIVSERDVVRAMPGRITELANMQVKDLMSKNVTTCRADTLVSALMRTMTEQRIRHIPVVDNDGNLLSIISIGDIVKAYVDEIESQRNTLEGYIAAG